MPGQSSPSRPRRQSRPCCPPHSLCGTWRPRDCSGTASLRFSVPPPPPRPRSPSRLLFPAPVSLFLFYFSTCLAASRSTYTWNRAPSALFHTVRPRLAAEQRPGVRPPTAAPCAPVGGHLWGFRVLATLSKAAVSAGMRVFELVFRVSSDRYPGTELLGRGVVLFLTLTCAISNPVRGAGNGTDQTLVLIVRHKWHFHPLK